jgi:hypothetical protein
MSKKFSLNLHDWKRWTLHLAIIGAVAILTYLSQTVLPGIEVNGTTAIAITLVSSVVDLAIRYLQGVK